MDYIVASCLFVLKLRGLLLLSYDIACQWYKHLRERFAANTFPSHLELSLPNGRVVRFAIPKYHFRAHKEEGHSIFSLWLMVGAAISDCEEIERAWWKFEGTQASIREMGPASRHDTLEDHFGWGNWCKFTTLGECRAFI